MARLDDVEDPDATEPAGEEPDRREDPTLPEEPPDAKEKEKERRRRWR